MNSALPSDVIIQRERPDQGAAARRAPRTRKEPEQLSSKTPPPKPTKNKSPQTTFERHKMHIIGILFGVMALFVLIALISYTPRDISNASLSVRELGGVFAGNEQVRARADTTENWLGLLGAMIANTLYNSTIGYAALLLPVLMGFWARALYRNEFPDELIIRTLLAGGLGVLFAGMMGTFQLVTWMPTLAAEWSGAIGQFVASVLSQFIGTLGSAILLLALGVITLMIGIDLDPVKTIHRGRMLVLALLDRWDAMGFRLSLPSLSIPVRDDQEEEQEAAAPKRAMLRPLKKSAPPAAQTQPEEEDTEEPAVSMRRRAERSGTARNLPSLISKIAPEEHDEEEQEEVGETVDSTPAEPVIATAAPTTRQQREDSVKITRPDAAEEKGRKAAPTAPVDIDVEADDETATVYLTGGDEPEVQIDYSTGEIVEQQPAAPAAPKAESAEQKALRMTVRETTTEEVKVRAKHFVEHDPLDEDIVYTPPHVDLLSPSDEESTGVDDEELAENGRTLREKLRTFRIEIEDLTVTPGPVVTQYEFVPAAGIKIAQIENLSDDIALALKARGIRIIAPVPGRGTVGVEIPNHKAQMVKFSSIITSPKFHDSKHRLPIALGKTISGEVYCDDLAKMPHLLIAGSTGAGKSVGVNTIICSLLYKMHPRNLKLAIIDPKKIEMTQYRPLINHYLAICPDIDETIVTTPQNAIVLLQSVVAEMERRYDILAKVGQRNIVDYNKKVRDGAYKDTTDFVHRELPYIVVIIDELADLMMTASKDIEEPITRLAQLARAIGIHLVVATQRPSVDVITGLIKANFPARIAYQVASKIDSRTIIDGSGAEHLLGNGDMLYLPGGSPKPVRIQNSFISTEEVEAICDHVGDQVGYSQPFYLPSVSKKSGGAGGGFEDDRDDFFEEAARVFIRHQQGSTSLLQRRLKIGYSRAARIVDQLEEAGIVGAFDGSKARAVLLESEADLEAYL